MHINFRFIVFALSFLSCFASLAAAQTRTRTFDAQHYIIRTSFDYAQKSVTGETIIRLKPLAANFKALTLDAANLGVQTVTLADSDAPLKFTVNGALLNITLDKVYAPIDTVAVKIKYQKLKSESGVYFIEADKMHSAQIWTQGEPEDSRNWFPSYDFPDDKATTEQFITTLADETAIANGELVETIVNADKTKTFHYRMTVPHSTYLTSFVVGKFAKVEQKYKDIPLGFYVYPGTEDIVPRAFGKTAKIMEMYENLLGVKFPFNKYDQTVVSAFQFGGMENVTATTMADTEIYAARAADNLVDTEQLVAHELAHSWFGDLVTCKNWANLWLNEGFATFFEAAYLEREYGREAYLNEMKKNAAQYLLEETFVKHPLLNSRAVPNILLFDATTYKKGGYVVHMLRETVGDDVFWKSLNLYLNRHKQGNVETADLQKAFEETSGKNLDYFFDQWIRRPGFPKLTVEPLYDAASRKMTLTVRQTQTGDNQTPEVFRFDAEVELDTPSGAVTQKIAVNQRVQSFTFDLPAKPTRINFDKREQVLTKVTVKPVAAVKTKTA